MKTGLVTRGFDQQLDYNVMAQTAPFGVEVHQRIAALKCERTTVSDGDFSFVVMTSYDKWEILLNCITTERRDFSGSPLRTYLYLCGTYENAEDWMLAKRIFLSEVIAHQPNSRISLTTLGKMLDAVLTDDVIMRLVGWDGRPKLNAEEWESRVLLPTLRKHPEPSIDKCENWLRDFTERIEELHTNRMSGKITGEWLPFVSGSLTDDPNLTIHYSSGNIRIHKNGEIENILPVKKKIDPIPPLDPSKNRPKPKVLRPKTSVILLMILCALVVLIKCCKTSSVASEHDGGETSNRTVETNLTDKKGN